VSSVHHPHKRPLHPRLMLIAVAALGCAVAVIARPDLAGMVSGAKVIGTSTAPVARRVNPAASTSTQPACAYAPSRRVADVRTKAIQEASALVSSERWPGIYWTLNDHGGPPTLVAFDDQGRPRSASPVTGAENTDWEALQPGPGRDGNAALYIGDIGDNAQHRRDVTIYRVPEPEPAPPANGEPGMTPTPPAEAFKLAYPDGPHNAEAMLVHPKTGETVLITKDSKGHSGVYRASLPPDAGHVGTLVRVADLDVSALGSPGNLVTDASISPDGHRVAVRTYTSVLEYDLPDGASLGSIWSQTPRISRLDDGPKGEGIAYRPDGLTLVTIGEGSPASVYEARRTC
jgi:hypothetical protein